MTGVITAEPGRRLVGMQLPIQAQSTMFASPWEASAGPEELARIARTCDRAGFDYVGACDHVAIPRDAADTMSTFWMDPIATLSWVAAHTEQVGLLTHVYVLPLRHSLVAAKQFATLDHLSGGRAIAGIGAGHVRAEFDALDIEFDQRGHLLDDGLDALTRALEHEYVGDLGSAPRPVQQPRPPIWIAGSSAPALRRAATFGDGWLPQGPATAGQVDELHRRLEANGRSPGAFVVGHIPRPVHVGEPSWEPGRATITGSGERIAEALLADTPPGVNQIQLRVVARDVDECCDQIGATADEVVPHLRENR